jgi:capsular polysaccharide transport system permease protein
MGAALVALRGRAVDPDPRAAAPASPAQAGGLPVPAESGELAPVQPAPFASRAIERPRRAPLALLSFVLIVALPTVIAAGYYLLIAADQYVAEFRFGLRSSEPIRADNAALSPVGPAALQTALDSYAVAQYIGSRAVVDDLGKTLDLRKMFSTSDADWPARLHLPATIEELVAYWRRQVDAFFDPTNGTIVVRAQAFTSGDALRLAQAILASSESLVNDLSARARRDALRSSEGDVDTGERRLSAALARLREYRDRQGLIDPHKAADANAALAGRLRDELVRAKTDLSTMKEYMQADAPALKLLEARIETLTSERSAVESEATTSATTQSKTLSGMIGSYEELEGERRFAETAYQHALEALDRARLDADRQQLYVADFVPPRRPEEALYPRRLRSIAIVFIAAFVIWAIGGLTVRSVRDHL